MTLHRPVLRIRSKPLTRDSVWMTADREQVRVRDMEDKHLRRLALCMIGMGYQEFAHMSDARKAEWLEVLKAEWSRRRSEGSEFDHETEDEDL